MFKMKEQGNRSLFKVLFVVFLSLITLATISNILESLLPPAFQVLDFFSELSVLTFALLWFLILKQITDRFDRTVVALGIGFFTIGAFADILDEFGFLLEIRGTIENLSFVAGFLLVSLGLRDWVRNNYIKYKEAIENNEYLALHDVLTGLNNRESLMYALDFRMGRHRNSEDYFALIFIDLDRFKSINDTLGHQVGDMLLKEVADRMESSIRATDHCFRIGGDEFVIVATDISREEDAYLICRKLINALGEPYNINGNNILSNGSFGIALYPRDGSRKEELLKNADLAMYAAKKKKQHIKFFSEELSQIANTKAEVEADLREALERQDLYMCYQPIVSRQGDPVALEALIRWEHPVKGKIHPESFIPLAEETGLILPLGELVLRKSMMDFQNYFADLEQNLSITVNISVLQLQEDNFPSIVMSALAESQMAPENLILEITESVIIDQIDNFEKRMSPLLEAGVRFAIDDFGSGYSSLNYLQKLPVEIIKFDRELLNGSDDPDDNAKVLHGLVDITRDLGKQVIVEGIETGNQSKIFSEDMDIMFQGYYFARPNKKDQVRNWIDKVTGMSKYV